MVDKAAKIGNNTRFDIQVPTNGAEQLPSGYQGNSPIDYTIPSCSIEDVDIALYELFDKHIGFKNAVVPDEDGPITLNKPYVIMATGERFALIKKLRPPRDKLNKQLMLPAISIRRTSILQNYQDMVSRGMNQFTGDIVIKRRLSTEDRDYQNLFNKFAMENLNPGNASSTRTQGLNRPAKDLNTYQGNILVPELQKNVWEIISIPQPQFYTANYEVIFWTSHTLHMNYLITTFLASQLPQGKIFRLNTEKGYWFIASVADEISTSENLDNFKEDKIIIKYSFQISVKAFLLAPDGPGNPVPVKRIVSATEISFSLEETSDLIKSPSEINPNIIKSDDPFLLTEIESVNNEQKQTTNHKLLVQKNAVNILTGKNQYQQVKLLEANQKSGETVYWTNGFTNLDEFVESLGYRSRY